MESTSTVVEHLKHEVSLYYTFYVISLLIFVSLHVFFSICPFRSLLISLLISLLTSLFLLIKVQRFYSGRIIISPQSSSIRFNLDLKYHECNLERASK
jgi:hypothetical protein